MEEIDIFLTNNYHTSYLTTIITNVTNFITETKKTNSYHGNRIYGMHIKIIGQ
jgi:hypothetical protein